MITPLEAKQELYEVFVENKSGKPKAFLKNLVTKIYDHEPYPNNLAKPAAITTFFAGHDEESDAWIIELRIYVDGSLNARDSQNRLAEIIDKIEYGNTQYGGNISHIPAKYTKTVWETSWEQDLMAWTGLTKLYRGTESD